MTSLTRLEEPYASIQTEARAFADSLEPVAAEADASNDVHHGVLTALRRSGLIRHTVPGAFGGASEQVDPFAVCLIREQLMSVCSHADSLFALQGIGSFALATAGSRELQEAWLPRVATGEVLAALALTEPEAGSDLKGLRTTARQDGDAVVIDGRKSFISNAGEAGFYTVLAKEESGSAEGAGGLSAFLVPADLPGVSTSPAPELIAPHVLGDVHFDHVIVPAGHRIGQPGKGLGPVLATLAVFRISVAGAAVGLAQRALEEATRHARSREQFNRPLVRLGPVAGLLATSWADVASTRLLTHAAARLAGEDPRAHLEHSSLAKLAATEACSRVVDRCVQIMGRWGLVHESRIERCYRQARAMRIYEGASEVISLGIARQLAEEVA
ncbi:MAG: acyl-CoA dehydrogenase family protein [Actinomycetota bacterium]|nr:acyl-CoA dehydrogenase family protein [Actinomycetota bacterium]